jgi:transcriptional regulator with XRE-family HTH domain
MSKTVGHPNDTDFRLDLELVVRKQPGYGAALGRIIERAGVTQQEIAEHLKCDRTAISHWIREERWPSSQKLLDLLIFLKIDTVLLNEASKVLLGGELLGDVFHACRTINTFNVTEQQLLELIKNEDDQFEQDELIFGTLRQVVLIRQGLRGAGLKGGESVDPKAAKLFLEEYEKHKVERQSRKGYRRGHVEPDGSYENPWPGPAFKPRQEK